MYHFHMYELNQALPRLTKEIDTALIDLFVISHAFGLVVHVWWMLSVSRT